MPDATTTPAADVCMDVAAFISRHHTPYLGDATFLAGPTERTRHLWQRCQEALAEERRNNGCRAVDLSTISSITSHVPGYIDCEHEVIVGLQTDAPLKRALKPFGGVQIVRNALAERGLELPPSVSGLLRHVHTHNDAVFAAYDAEIRAYRSKHILTGLPDNYARGRIIGDYRRLALYGAERLIAAKKADHAAVTSPLDEHKVRLREEISRQIHALGEIVQMAAAYGHDVTRPASGAREATQWVYYAYLAAIKEQDGAAMSLGNVSTFLDVYFERDLRAGVLDEGGAQEIIDHFVMKLRLVRHLRPASYDEIFGGDPTWVTEALGGQLCDGRTKVTRTTYRFLQTLYNLGPAPEPNLTLLWSANLPVPFKHFCARVTLDTSSLQYENDDLMRSTRGSDDYGIACCVSHQIIGRTIQHFGARANLPKALLLALNAGREEHDATLLVPGIAPLPVDAPLDYEAVLARFKQALAHLAAVYARALHIIHCMHDKYYYERAQMAFVDTDPPIDIAYGAAGIAIIADSLSAIKHARVTARRDFRGIATAYTIEGEFPKYGNDDDRADLIAREITQYFIEQLCLHPTYRNARPTLSLLTITSNVMYGKNTGATPDGRPDGQPFAPGATPMHGRDTHGAIASLNSVAKLNYAHAQDGISNTLTLHPRTLGTHPAEQAANLATLLDGYFAQGAHHLNVNILRPETLREAYEHPEKHPHLTLRVSGYAVNFTRLSKAHQREVLERTHHHTLRDT